MLVLLGMTLCFFLAPAGASVSAQAPTGETPTIPPETPTPTATPTPIPVGGHLSVVDRGAVLRAAFGPWIMPSVALIVLIGIAGFVAIRRHSERR